MSLSYAIKEGIAGFKRARLASFTSIFSLFVAILLLGVLARISYNAYEVAQSMQQAIDVEIFLQDIDERTTSDLENELSQEPLVENVVYVSKDSAAAIFEEEFGAGASSMAEIDFLPASFKLRIMSDAEIDQVDSLVAELENKRGVDEVEFNQQLLEIIQTRFESVTKAGAGIGFLILLVAVILVFNTIRLTIYAKKNLIKAMKLVGATNSFIRRPFVIEGVLQGFIAGIMAVGVLFLLFQFIFPDLVPQFGVLEWPFGEWYYLCGAMVLLAVLMGYGGSQWAARKFIKETSIGE